MSGSLVVKAHKPGRTVSLALAGLVVAGLAGYALFELGQLRGGYNREQTGLERELLLAQLSEMDHQNALLRERVALLEESSRIDRETAQQLQQALSTQDGELLDLRQELAFYRGIISPDDGQAGLRLQEVTVEPAAPGGYGLELILVQSVRHDRNQAGRARITLEGVGPEGPLSLSHAELTGTDGAGLRYNFRYFLHLSGTLSLPEGFRPSNLTVTLDPDAGGQAELVRSYDWDELTQRSAPGEG